MKKLLYIFPLLSLPLYGAPTLGGPTLSGIGGTNSASGSGGGVAISNAYNLTFQKNTSYTNATAYYAEVSQTFKSLPNTASTPILSFYVDTNADGVWDVININQTFNLGIAQEISVPFGGPVPPGAVFIYTNNSGIFTTLSPYTNSGNISYTSTNGASGGSGGISLTDVTNAATTVFNAGTTNTTLHSGAYKVVMTNYNALNGNNSNTVLRVTPEVSFASAHGGFQLNVDSGGNVNNGDLFSVFVNPDHASDGGSVQGSEVQISASGSIAISPGYQLGIIRHLQKGIGGTHYGSGGSQTWNYWSYGQACKAYTNSPGYSWSDTYKVDLAGSLYYPGLISRSWTNNDYGPGIHYEIDLLEDLNATAGGLADTWSIDTVKPGLSYYKFPTNGIYGFKHRGGVVEEKVVTTSSSATVLLDFGPASSTVIDASASSITLATTNSLANSTNAEPRRFLIRANGNNITTVNYPGWSFVTNSGSETLPTAIPPGYQLRLDLESYGQGESNKVVWSAKIGVDTVFAWDADASSYFTRASITNNAFKSAVNTFFTSLKTANIFTNFGAIYFFPAEAGWRTNAVNTSNNIAVTGTVYATNGIGFAAANSAYLDTGFNPNANSAWAQNSAVMAMYVGNTFPSNTLAGADSGASSYIRFYVNGANAVEQGLNNTAVLPISAIGDFSGLWLATRTASTTFTWYLRSSSYPDSTASAAPPTSGNIFIGARNNGGSAANYAEGNIRFFALGRGLDASGVTAFQSAVSTLKTALGWP